MSGKNKNGRSQPDDSEVIFPCISLCGYFFSVRCCFYRYHYGSPASFLFREKTRAAVRYPDSSSCLVNNYVFSGSFIELLNHHSVFNSEFCTIVLNSTREVLCENTFLYIEPSSVILCKTCVLILNLTLCK